MKRLKFQKRRRYKIRVVIYHGEHQVLHRIAESLCCISERNITLLTKKNLKKSTSCPQQ